MKKKILVIGSLNMDMCIRVRNIPKTGETILAGNVSYVLGGKGSNQAGSAGRLGGNVAMLGYVGDDEFGKRQRDELGKNHVDVSALGVSEENSTGTAVIYVDDDGNNTIVVVAGANSDCKREYIEKQDALLKDCDYVLLQMEIPVSAIGYAVKRAKELGKTVILNPAPAPAEISDEILKYVDYLTPNETEIATLSGCSPDTLESIEEGARKLIGRGVRNVLITLGEKGSFLVKKDSSHLYPARKVKAVDTTAAGDCFNSAFLVALSEGKSEEEAIMFASAASSIAVTRKGALQSIPVREETDQALEEWKKAIGEEENRNAETGIY